MTTAAAPPLRVALVGNPNSGKTCLFNLLTGSRAKVANYPGVTVERKEGLLTAGSGRVFTILDLPGIYSLRPTSPDEAITINVCQGRFTGEARPDVIVCVASATNLRLHLRFVLEMRELGVPMIVALNMMDEARAQGIHVDREVLERELGLPVVETIAVHADGAQALVDRLDHVSLEVPVSARDGVGSDVHARVRSLLAAAVTMPPARATIDDAIDRWVLNPVAGLAILAVTMFLMFQAVFAWSKPLMDGVQAGIDAVGRLVIATLPDGMLRSLIVDGVLAGAGSVLVFVPQILILFALIFALEESGYLPRAAYLLDRLMVGAGLTGRSFIPLLSSFACAVPGIMAARTIPNARDRLATIAVAPLMTCSARLPVYTLLIAAFIPTRTVLGFFNLQGVVLFVLYAAGVAAALLVAALLKRIGHNTTERALLLEIPPWRLPRLRSIAIGLWERAHIFIFERIGKIIIACSIVLWFLAHVPGPPPGATEPAINYSIAGALGHALAVVFAPIGFTWQICISLIPGMAAREVVISSLATTYALSATKADAAASLVPIIAKQWTLPTALSLLAWYVFSPQCLSTLAVIRRETNSWRTLGWVTAYLFVLAYVASFITYRVALAFTGSGS